MLKVSSIFPPALSSSEISATEEVMARWGKIVLCAYLVAIISFGAFVSTKVANPDLTLFLQVNGFDPLNAAGFAALYVCFIGCRPSRNALYLSFGISAFLELVYHIFVLPAGSSVHTHLLTLGSGAGAAGFLCMLGLLVWESDKVQRRRISIWLIAGLCLALYPLGSSKAIGTLSMLAPQAVDSHVYVFEGSLGFFPAQLVASTLASSEWLQLLFLSVYCRLPVFIFLAFLLNARYPNKNYFEIFPAFFAGAITSFPYYVVLPMVGLTVFIGMPPWPFEALPHIEELKTVLAPPNMPRTCLPSMHTTWILMFFFCVKRISKPLCYLGVGIVALTLLSTVSALVGHYSVDVLVSFPFCLAFMALACKSKSGNGKIRAVCVAFGLGTTAIWCFAFRLVPGTMLEYAPLFWILMVIGCLTTLWLENELAKATFATMPEQDCSSTPLEP